MRERALLPYVCFALRGVAALIQQTAWAREFALLFGRA